MDSPPRLRLDETVDIREVTPERAALSPFDLVTGATVGRYVVLSPIGAGGMGVVYAAFDPELDRKVALKLVRVGAADMSSLAEQRQRLVREAQAMARLSHPNVAAVHDVGSHGDAVFIAMEFIDGDTLATWLAVERPWAAVVDVLVAAGRGLAAAHGADLLHRDFKPDNVMVGSDGRVRVMDFGLARERGSGVADKSAPIEGGDSGRRMNHSASLSNPLTQAGTLVGTPAYMAPEQLLGAATDARADQFSFCVAAWKALYGQRPFAGASAGELVMNVVEGRLRDPPASSRVPARVRRVLVRGLATDPNARWTSMTELLAALERNRTTRLRLWLGAVGIAVVAAAASALASQGANAQCTESRSKLAGVWDDAAATTVRDAFVGAASHGAQSFGLMRVRLDQYASTWVEQHESSCKATHVVGDQSQSMMDLRTACLDTRLDAVAALVRVFAVADRTTAERSVDAVDELPPLDSCANAEYLEAAVKPPELPELAAKVDELRGRLADAAALNAAARHASALEVARALREEAEALDYLPLVAEILVQLGHATYAGGVPAEGIDAMREAFFVARSSGHDSVAQTAAIALVGMYSDTGSNLSNAQNWAEHARADLIRSPSPALDASIDRYLGVAYREAGQFEEAQLHLRRALETDRGRGDPHSPALLSTLNALGNTLQAMGRDEEAEPMLREGLATYEATHGAEHPRLAQLAHNLGVVLEAQGRYEEALVLHDRVLAIWGESLGRGSSRFVASQSSRALVLSRLGRHDEAISELTAALETAIALTGPNHDLAAQIQGNLGVAHGLAGNLQESARAYEAALQVFRQLQEDPTHPVFAKLASNLGAAYERLGDTDAARIHYVDALARYEARFGPTSIMLGNALTGLARLERDAGRRREALALAERALSIRDGHTIANDDLALTRLLVARLRADLGDAEGARVMATVALVDASASHAEDLRALLATLPGPGSTTP